MPSEETSDLKVDLSADVQIVGGGLAGLSLAAALGTAGISTLLIDRESLPDDTAFAEVEDNRTTALIQNSVTFLDACGVWDVCKDQATPLSTMRIVTLPLSKRNPSSITDFDSRELEKSPFGYNVPNILLRRALCQRLRELPSVTHLSEAAMTAIEMGGEMDEDGHIVTLADGRRLQAKLTVGADGKNSPTRKAAGICAMSWPYPQTAITCYIEHSKPHQNISTETHYPAGPFTLVPMSGKRSSIVWVEESRLAKKLLAMDEVGFTRALEQKIKGRLGRVKLFGRRGGFPLSAMLCHTFVAPRLALIAEAAHALPPIAAQGLNLSLRDVAVLAELLIEQHHEGADPGDSALLESYDRARRFDVVSRLAAADGLNRFASNDSFILHTLRSLSFTALRNIGPLRRMLMRAGMDSPTGTPALMSGKPIR